MGSTLQKTTRQLYFYSKVINFRFLLVHHLAIQFKIYKVNLILEMCRIFATYKEQCGYMFSCNFSKFSLIWQ